MPNAVEKEITVYLCPRCAREGGGPAKLKYINLVRGGMFCLTCGWSGEMSKAQQHSYPCKIYKTVEMEISVLMCMWDAARPEKAPELPWDQVFVPWFIAIEHENEVPPATRVWIDQALTFLVNKEFLPLAHYKLVPDDTTTS